MAKCPLCVRPGTGGLVKAAAFAIPPPWAEPLSSAPCLLVFCLFACLQFLELSLFFSFSLLLKLGLFHRHLVWLFGFLVVCLFAIPLELRLFHRQLVCFLLQLTSRVPASDTGSDCSAIPGPVILHLLAPRAPGCSGGLLQISQIQIQKNTNTTSVLPSYHFPHIVTSWHCSSSTQNHGEQIQMEYWNSHKNQLYRTIASTCSTNHIQ